MFDIQLFADTVTSASELKVGLKFDDADTRIVTLPNPKANVTAQQVQDVFADAVTNEIFIGDKAGASLTGTYTAYKVLSTKTKLDISGN